MKNLFIHDFKTALYLWTQNQIAKKFEAFTYAPATTLYKSDDVRYQGYIAYSSPYKPWIADQSIAQPPLGITLNDNTFVPREPGIIYDFNNGRILSTTDLGPTIQCDLTYSPIGVYPSNHTEEEAVFENRYLPNARFAEITGTGVPPYDYLVPCVLLSVDSKEDMPFAFGGEDNTCVYAKAIIISDNDYVLDGIQSCLSDGIRTNFPAITAQDIPFNALWDTTGDYNYEEYRLKYGDSNFFIEEAKFSRLSNGARSRTPMNLAVGFVDFKITQFRYPRL